jgi:hypothetical protein
MFYGTSKRLFAIRQQVKSKQHDALLEVQGDLHTSDHSS